MGRQILVVEDNEVMLKFTAAVLTAAGHQVASALSVADARKILDGHAHRETLCLVVDVVIDRDSGIEFAEEVTQRLPSVHVLLISGFTDDVLMMKPGLSSRTAFLAKPFSKEDLLSAIEKLCAR